MKKENTSGIKLLYLIIGIFIFWNISVMNLAFAQEKESEYFKNFKANHSSDGEEITKNIDQKIFKVEKRANNSAVISEAVYFTDGINKTIKVVNSDRPLEISSSQDSSKVGILILSNPSKTKIYNHKMFLYSSSGEQLLETGVRHFGELEISNNGDFAVHSSDLKNETFVTFYSNSGQETNQLMVGFCKNIMLKYSLDGKYLFLFGSPLLNWTCKSPVLIAFNPQGNELWRKTIEDIVPLSLTSINHKLDIGIDSVAVEGYGNDVNFRKILFEKKEYKKYRHVYDFKGNEIK
jgi:hypothetical protein